VDESAAGFDGRVAAVRAFSRFYTRRIGALHEGLLGSPLSLAEGRVVWELAQAEGLTPTVLAERLGLNPGYLSRILRALEGGGLTERRAVPADARQALIVLTGAGRDAYAAINTRSMTEIAAMLAPLRADEQEALVQALGTAERLLGRDRVPANVTLRRHRPGDLGWVIARQMAIYEQEFGWDGSFETVLAEIAAVFLRDYDPARDACWLAERDGMVLGSVTLAHSGAGTAKLRMLYVEPAARGLGVGRMLVRACIARAREIGYRRMLLWTNDVLVAARRIYADEGFVLIEAEPPAPAFGQIMVSETWALDLAATAEAAAR